MRHIKEKRVLPVPKKRRASDKSVSAAVMRMVCLKTWAGHDTDSANITVDSIEREQK